MKCSTALLVTQVLLSFCLPLALSSGFFPQPSEGILIWLAGIKPADGPF